MREWPAEYKEVVLVYDEVNLQGDLAFKKVDNEFCYFGMVDDPHEDRLFREPNGDRLNGCSGGALYVPYMFCVLRSVFGPCSALFLGPFWARFQLGLTYIVFCVYNRRVETSGITIHCKKISTNNLRLNAT